MKIKNGFTIFELLAAISIVGILTAIAIPNMISWRSEAKLRGALNNLRGDLQMAKQRALREKAIVAVIFTANGYKVFIDNGAGADRGNWNIDPGELVIRDKKLPAGVTIALPTSFDSPNNRTRFDGRGLPDPATLTGSGLTGTVALQLSGGNQKQISINRLGRIYNS